MAAFDRREAILLRILEILGGIEGIVSIGRNRGDWESIDTETGDDILPAAVLLDGKEATLSAASQRGGSDGSPTAKLMTLEPQIFIILKPSDDVRNLGKGEELSAFRMKVIPALEDDGELRGLLGTNGTVLYKGVTTDMQTGSSIQGQMLLEFAFVYHLNPAEMRN